MLLFVWLACGVAPELVHYCPLEARTCHCASAVPIMIVCSDWTLMKHFVLPHCVFTCLPISRRIQRLAFETEAPDRFEDNIARIKLVLARQHAAPGSKHSCALTCGVATEYPDLASQLQSRCAQNPAVKQQQHDSLERVSVIYKTTTLGLT